MQSGIDAPHRVEAANKLRMLRSSSTATITCRIKPIHDEQQRPKAACHSKRLSRALEQSTPDNTVPATHPPCLPVVPACEGCKDRSSGPRTAPITTARTLPKSAPYLS
eukprot:2441788-Pleurochrysis_carterae.AAC.2